MFYLPDTKDAIESICERCSVKMNFSVIYTRMAKNRSAHPCYRILKNTATQIFLKPYTTLWRAVPDQTVRMRRLIWYFTDAKAIYGFLKYSMANWRTVQYQFRLCGCLFLRIRLTRVWHDSNEFFRITYAICSICRFPSHFIRLIPDISQEMRLSFTNKLNQIKSNLIWKAV